MDDLHVEIEFVMRISFIRDIDYLKSQIAILNLYFWEMVKKI
jgi:hypothetical protein